MQKKFKSGRNPIAPVEMPGLDSHLCFALYAASNHMTRMFIPFLRKLAWILEPSATELYENRICTSLPSSLRIA